MTQQEIFYQILNRKTNDIESVRVGSDQQYEFSSVDEAINAHHSGVHKDKARYRIQEVRRVSTTNILNEDCLPPTTAEIKNMQKKRNEIKTIRIHRGVSLEHDQPTIIEIIDPIPNNEDRFETHEGDAQKLFKLIYDVLPGGTYDQLRELMMSHGR